MYKIVKIAGCSHCPWYTKSPFLNGTGVCWELDKVVNPGTFGPGFPQECPLPSKKD